MEQKNLYKVVCKGMKGSHGIAYVVANDPTEAYTKVKNYLDAKDIGFAKRARIQVDKSLEELQKVAQGGS